MFTLIGVIFLIVIGPAVGNYACSVVYRLPRGKTPFERHPFCGHCNADLKPIDLFPILSWCLTRGKCRYCGGAIPGIYTLIELVCGVAFIGYFLKFGMGEAFLLYAAYATFVVMVAAIEWQQGWISATLYSYAIALLLVLRAIAEHTVFGTVQSAFLMLLAMLLLHRVSPRRKDVPFTVNWIWWMVLLGAELPVTQWSLLLVPSAIALVMAGRWRVGVFAATALGLPFLGEISLP